MDKPTFEQTEERCGTCNKKLIKDIRGHYVCLKCERNHPCLGLKDSRSRRTTK